MADDGSEKTDLQLPSGEVGDNIKKAFEGDQTVVERVYASSSVSVARDRLVHSSEACLVDAFCLSGATRSRSWL